MQVVRDNISKASTALKTELINAQQNYRKRMRKARQLCAKADEKYLPYGLAKFIPESWECGFPGSL